MSKTAKAKSAAAFFISTSDTTKNEDENLLAGDSVPVPAETSPV
ncbi:hypothetical protein [Bradyrhizobium sp.]|nr:hypothetical protein [Bradyrhizobium sp.]HZR71302.1 hypothetical protein [Bradyrhizobium sp.]